MKKLILITMLLGCGILSATAQGNYFSFQYSMGLGIGDMGDYNSKYSFRGAMLEWRRYINPSIGIGIDLGWNAFYQAAPYDTYTRGTASLSGKQYRYQNQFPMLAVATYNFRPGEKVKPFAGLGLGTMNSIRNTEMYVYSLGQDAWHFAMSPQVGVMYELGYSASLYLGLKYNIGFASGDFEETQSYLAINVGYAFGE